MGMKLLGLLFFTVVGWKPALVRWILQQPDLPSLPGMRAALSTLDQWVVIPQIRLLLFLSPPLEESWPGPFTGSITLSHEILLCLAYALLGWVSIWFIWRIESDTLGRWIRLIAAWLLCFGFLEGVSLLFLLLKVFPTMG